MIDLEKLSPAPWEELMLVSCGKRHHWARTPMRKHPKLSQADAQFCAIARNAFDVMMRRGWSPCLSPIKGEGWRVDMNDGDYFSFGQEDDEGVLPAHWPDPFTALVEADKWYAKREGKEG